MIKYEKFNTEINISGYNSISSIEKIVEILDKITDKKAFLKIKSLVEDTKNLELTKLVNSICNKNISNFNVVPQIGQKYYHKEYRNFDKIEIKEVYTDSKGNIFVTIPFSLDLNMGLIPITDLYF
jgi:hydrogenase maturation factor